MRGSMFLAGILVATSALGEVVPRHDPFSSFYAPTEMFLVGKRAVGVQHGISKGAEMTRSFFTLDDGDTNGRFTDVNLILTDDQQRMQIGGFFSSGTNKYEGTSIDHFNKSETRVGNRTDYSIFGVDLSSRFNESWLWAIRMQTVRYRLSFHIDQFHGALGATTYTAYSPTLEWRGAPWSVRLSHQPTINYMDRYPVRLAGFTKLALLHMTPDLSWGIQLLERRDKAIEEKNRQTYELVLGADQRLGAWGWDTYASYQTSAWTREQFIEPTTLATWSAGLGAKWLKSEDLAVGLRFETKRAPKTSGLANGTKFEADLIEDTINLYVDYAIDAPKVAAAPSSP